MSPMGILPYMNYQQRHEELIKQAENYRLLEEATKMKMLQKSSFSKILSLLGKELSSLGFSLEVRYGGQPEPGISIDPQGNPGECS